MRQAIRVLIETNALTLQGESKIIEAIQDGSKTPEQAFALLQEYLERKYANQCRLDLKDLCKQASSFNAHLQTLRLGKGFDQVVNEAIAEYTTRK